jgi:diguanylate cyclase (GGDEF)-like protein/PAS domain S-box-containing protein
MTHLSSNSILVVDDTPANLKVLFDILQDAGFRVSIAKSGESALVKAEESNLDLILLDVMMPKLNGFETCRRLKSNPKTQNIPVIFLSALSETVDKVTGFQVGGADYITKPFQTEEVLARVRTQLALQTAKVQLLNLTSELEKRVQKRTEQLATINQQLLQEITDRREAQDALLKSEKQFRLAFDLAPIGIALTTLKGKFLQVNSALCRMFEYDEQELYTFSWMELAYPDDLPVSDTLEGKLQRGEISHFQIESRYLTKTGKIVYALANFTAVCDVMGKPLHLLGQFVDLSDRKQAEEQLVYNTLHDSLTRLPNRNLLQERLSLSLERAKQNEDYLFALLCIDLDRFKVVNESLGHQIGDELLLAIAKKLKQIVRPTDMVARLGGDEFAILLDPIEDIKDAIHIAQRLCEQLNIPVRLAGQEVVASASVGIVLGDVDYERSSSMLRDADIAMYRAKAKGKGCYEVFAHGMYAQALARLQLENELRLAIERQEFQLFYQPIVSLLSGEIMGFEALARWQHRERGFISPDEFIPLAEETGAIVPLGEWVLQTACEQMVLWQKQYPKAASLTVGVNLSAEQLREPDFIAKVDRILAQTGLRGGNLNLELTESMLMDRVEQLLNLLSQLKARGIQLSIDDFGTGYSSLSYLHRFPVDYLKIDRSFIMNLQERGDHSAIVQTIVALANQMKLKAIAEGVEESSHLHLLQVMGCHEAQGYLFSKPLERELAGALLERELSSPIFPGYLKQ